MGLWHGANWTFIIWGVWHSLLIYSQRQIQKIFKIYNKSISKIFGWLITIPLIMIGWIPFRAESVSDTFQMLKIVLDWKNYILIDELSNPYIWAILPININPLSYITTALLVLSMPIVYIGWRYFLPLIKSNPRISFPAIFTYGSILIALVFIYLKPVQQFIYFAF